MTLTAGTGAQTGNTYCRRIHQLYCLFTVGYIPCCPPAVHPHSPELVPDFINTMLNIREQQGKLPVWSLAGNETDCMIGYHAVPVIADAVQEISPVLIMRRHLRLQSSRPPWTFGAWIITATSGTFLPNWRMSRWQRQWNTALMTGVSRRWRQTWAGRIWRLRVF
jgi:hypothetical protein